MNPNEPASNNPQSTPAPEPPEAPNDTVSQQPSAPVAPETTPTPQPQSPLPPATPGPGYGPTASSSEGAKSKKPLVILLIVVVLLLLAGGAFALTQMKDNKKTTTTPTAPSAASQDDSVLAGQQAKARDSERQADINALHSHIEAYFAQNGYYPTLTELNDRAFRTTNMKGLDPDALQDPEGKDAVLVAKPLAKTYAYAATAKDGTECVKEVVSSSKDCFHYTLTATLSDGSTYIKKDLNQE
jgi:type II secretory pathway pseudopilin PulG